MKRSCLTQLLDPFANEGQILFHLFNGNAQFIIAVLQHVLQQLVERRDRLPHLLVGEERVMQQRIENAQIDIVDRLVSHWQTTPFSVKVNPSECVHPAIYEA